MYDERTIVNRDIAGQKSRLDEMEVYLDVPDEIVLVADLSKELMEKQEKNTSRERQVENLEKCKDSIEQTENTIQDLRDELAGLQDRITSAEHTYSCFEKDKVALTNTLNDMETFDLTELQAKINNAEETNTKIRSNHQYAIDSELHENNKTKSQNLTNAIDEIDNNKSKQLENADFPVKGLSFNEDDVLYNDLPFDEKQLSSEELLKVSFAMAIASSPTLKTILIRHGAFLDKNNLKLIGQMAKKANIHVFVEIVGNVDNDIEASVLMIENGKIVNEFDDI